MKKFIAVIIPLALGTFITLWFSRPKTVPTAKTGETSAPAVVKVEAPKSAASTSIAAPVMPPAAKPAAAPQPVAADPAQSATQKELNVMIDDMATMVQSGDMIGMMEKYASPDDQNRASARSPEQRAALQQALQQTFADPAMQPLFQAEAQALQSLKDQTPELNATGDQATYQMAMPSMTMPSGQNIPARTQTVSFQKVDGQWYLKSQ